MSELPTRRPPRSLSSEGTIRRALASNTVNENESLRPGLGSAYHRRSRSSHTPRSHTPIDNNSSAESESQDSSDDGDTSRPPSPTASVSSTVAASLGGWSEASSLASPRTAPFRFLFASKDSHPRTYYLNVVQHPQRAAEFGVNDMARIPLAPPLFVQLSVKNKSGAFISADEELPFLVAAITLHDAAKPDPQDLSSNSALYGTRVAAPQNLRDPEGNRGVYFIFPDVGVRRRGQWRLYVSLMRIALIGSSSVLANGDSGTHLAGAWTNPFDIVPAETYVALAITPLTRHFQSQGIRMFISNSVVRDRS